MTAENGLVGDHNNNEAATSPEKTNGKQDLKKSVNTLPYYKLFSFADSKDVLLMVIGTIASLANGMTMPVMTLFIGDMINAFGLNEHNTNTLRAVSKVCLNYVYLANGAGIASFFQVTCWMVTGERQASRMRSLYLQTILRQDVGFFDTETSTGEVVGRMSGDTVLIQDVVNYYFRYRKNGKINSYR